MTQSSFWATSDGEDLSKTTGEADMGGGVEVIPPKTIAKAVIDEIKWDVAPNQIIKVIAARWRVMEPEAYKNRVIFQKIKVHGDPSPQAKPEKQAKTMDKARRMLAAIDVNAKGGLTQLQREPTDADLQVLKMKPMLIQVMTWSMKNDSTGEVSVGNWVNSVAPVGSAEPVAGNPADIPKTAGGSMGGAPAGGRGGVDDEIPFAPW